MAALRLKRLGWFGAAMLAGMLGTGNAQTAAPDAQAPVAKPEAPFASPQSGQQEQNQKDTLSVTVSPVQTTTPEVKPDQADPKKPETHINAAQAKELFATVDDLLKFASDESQLPIKQAVKRKLTTRIAVEKYLTTKMNDDKDAKRMERSEIVLKKFGLLDRDFDLKTFLVSLLKEQIAGYYDSKTKTVNLLDWIEPDAQKPVLAHELTHALQDQHSDLEKWEDQSKEDISRNVTEDNEHLATDEADTAREAVTEGQAMAVFVDYSLRPLGQSLMTAPDMVENLKDSMKDSQDSPVLARAPLLLQESLLFPYREGLGFEQTLLKDTGVKGAFAGALDRPPSTSYEILHPKAYEHEQKIPLMRMPDVHGLLDANWTPYDVGVMGALDVRMVAELFGGETLASQLTPLWDGGVYFAAQRREAKTPEQRASTASVALIYLSRWKSPEGALAFEKMYADELGKKYSNVTRDTAAETSESEQIYKTSEGPVLLQMDGNSVFVSETFDLTTARKLQFLMAGAQGGGDSQQAAVGTVPRELTGSMVHFLGGCGMMKAAMFH
jgi:hypothetical protein